MKLVDTRSVFPTTQLIEWGLNQAELPKHQKIDLYYYDFLILITGFLCMTYKINYINLLATHGVSFLRINFSELFQLKLLAKVN